MKKLALVCQRNAKLPFIFEAAKAANIELVMIYDIAESAPIQLPAAVTSTWQLPVFDHPDLALDAFAAGVKERNIGGVMTLCEKAIIWTALAAKKINTPSIEPEVAALTRNKYLMRQAFVKAGLRTPRFFYIDNPEDLSQAHALGWPLVIKPVSGAGSIGVMLAKNSEEFPDIIKAVWNVQHKDMACFNYKNKSVGLVVEQYLPGKEFVVECFVDTAGVHVLAVGDKGQPEGPWFEETIYRQRRDIDDPLIIALCKAACSGVKALGINMGAAHVELRLDANDLPYVIEIGARIGGSGVSHFIVEQGTGISFGKLCMNAALAEQNLELPDVLPAEKVAANYIIPLRGHGRFSGFSGLDKVVQHPLTTRTIIFFEIDHISPPPPAFGGYPGFIFSVHASNEEARDYHKWLDDTLSIIWKDHVYQ
ncbi:ATP-grasp domain-containing protein [Bartonella taylorii]|uniref:ATP-grasp domain-containing protein n=1 Tax=Bartonella taylorii TaxID=33046 RepID=UPI001ABBC75F|nr:ATP-grasp domain-containing protein [Bartonella taylorii]